MTPSKPTERKEEKKKASSCGLVHRILRKSASARHQVGRSFRPWLRWVYCRALLHCYIYLSLDIWYFLCILPYPIPSSYCLWLSFSLSICHRQAPGSIPRSPDWPNAPYNTQIAQATPVQQFARGRLTWSIAAPGCGLPAVQSRRGGADWVDVLCANGYLIRLPTCRYFTTLLLTRYTWPIPSRLAASCLRNSLSAIALGPNEVPDPAMTIL